jgi:eukaryotic-like serine/threonine-protein kinase
VLQTISQYEIRRKIGEGGMGVVFEGWDGRLGRHVAIKTLRGATESEDAKNRLWSEARSLARVSHPRVCQIYDVLEQGRELFLVLEFLEGRSLADRLGSGPMTAAEAIGIEQQVLEALDALHALGIVHRDLKPSNVFLTPHGVKLLDFGLARSSTQVPAAAQAEAVTAITAPGLIVGTPHYMAPEQAKSSTVGPAVDIFAAGCILYEMLAGKRAFDGASVVDILYAVLHNDPPPLSGSREIEALELVIRRAIGKRPEDRYPTARNMLEALNAVPSSSGSTTRVKAATVTRLIALPFRWLKEDQETAFLAHSLPDAITNSLSGIDRLIVRSSLLATRFAGVTDLKQIAAEAGVDAILAGSLMRVDNRLRLTCQLVEAPSGTVLWSETLNCPLQDLFEIEDELCTRTVQALMLPLTERERDILRRDVPRSPKAYECYLRANQMATIRTLNNMKQARGLYLQCLDDDPDYAPAWAQLARTKRFIEKFGDAADQHFPSADDAFQRAFALNPDLAIAHNLYTPVQCDQGQAAPAMHRLLTRACFRRNDPDLFAGLVQACRYCGELEASIAAHSRAQDLDRNVVTSVAHTYFLLGEYEKALACYGTKAGFYLDCAALVALGDREEALARLRDREQSGGATGSLRAIMRSLRYYLEGNVAECLKATDEGKSHASLDPESLYYMARQLAQIQQTERAVEVLSGAIEKGFVCVAALESDPCFTVLRLSPGYGELLRRVQLRRDAAHRIFLDAGGPELLNVTYTSADQSPSLGTDLLTL